MPHFHFFVSLVTLGTADSHWENGTLVVSIDYRSVLDCLVPYARVVLLCSLVLPLYACKCDQILFEITSMLIESYTKFIIHNIMHRIRHFNGK